jgi:hypothetical protein
LERVDLLYCVPALIYFMGERRKHSYLNLPGATSRRGAHASSHKWQRL